MTKTPFKSAALNFARKGMYVFPCKSYGKIPIVKNGLHAASIDHSQIQDWANRYPDANIGLLTGEKSGIFVLDIDKLLKEAPH